MIIVIVTVIHILTSIGLILVVLLQQGKGAEMGAVFGGSSSTIFGSSGAGNFLTRLTTGMAIVFMITSLTLGYFAGRRPSATIFDNR
ncbi:MAG: preprotein translocase subunit SecG, partial [Deltaproteobacteria bacterium]